MQQQRHPLEDIEQRFQELHCAIENAEKDKLDFHFEDITVLAKNLFENTKGFEADFVFLRILGGKFDSLADVLSTHDCKDKNKKITEMMKLCVKSTELGSEFKFPYFRINTDSYDGCLSKLQSRDDKFSKIFALMNLISCQDDKVIFALDDNFLEDLELNLSVCAEIISSSDERFKGKRKKYEEFVNKVVVTQKDKFTKKDVPSDADGDLRIIYEAYNSILDHINNKTPSKPEYTGDKKYEFITIGIWLIDLLTDNENNKRKSGFDEILREGYRERGCRYPRQKSDLESKLKTKYRIDFLKQFSSLECSRLAPMLCSRQKVTRDYIDIGACIKYEEEEVMKNWAVMSGEPDIGACIKHKEEELAKTRGDIESTTPKPQSEKPKAKISLSSVFLVSLIIIGIVASLSLYTSINVLALLAIPVVYHSFISNAGLGLAVLSSVMLVFKAGLKPNKSGQVIATPGALNSSNLRAVSHIARGRGLEMDSQGVVPVIVNP